MILLSNLIPDLVQFVMLVLSLFAAIVLSNVLMTTVYVVVQSVRQGGFSLSVFPDGHDHRAVNDRHRA